MLVSTTFYFSVFVAYSTAVPGFTVRRMYENAREEFEKVELLREVNMCEVVRVNGGGGEKNEGGHRYIKIVKMGHYIFV